MRRDDLLVTVLLLHIAQEVLQPVAQRSAFGQPQRQSGSDPRRETKQLELLAQFAVVAFLGLLQHRQVLVEHRLFREGDAVDTGQHLVVLVAAPIGAGDRGQLDRLDEARVRQVRPAAQVGKITVRVEADRTVLEGADQFHFIFVALFRVSVECLGLRHFTAGNGLLTPGELFHFLLDLGQVRLGNGHRRIDVVIEPVLDAGADAELDARIERLERLGQQVRRRMPEGMLAFVVIPFVQFNLSICRDRHVQVAYLAVHRCGQYLLCQAGADALGYLHSRRSFGVLTNAAVRESYFNHLFLFYRFCSRVSTLRDGTPARLLLIFRML